MSEKILEVIFLPSSFKRDLVMLFLLLLFFASNFSFMSNYFSKFTQSQKEHIFRWYMWAFYDQ